MTASADRKTDGPVRRAIGAMTGTSGDGVDLALVETDGISSIRPVASYFLPFEPRESAAILAAAERLSEIRSGDRGDPLAVEAGRIVTRRHADALAAFASEAGFRFSEIDVIGMHGQTLFHDPARGVTLQVGEAHALATRFGVPVASNFRMADVRAGGQGAPLAPIYHRMLVGADGLPAVVVNIGGVSNITWLGADGAVIGFDTGAGNGALDRFVRSRTGQPFDRDGRLAAAGEVDGELLARLMRSDYYAAPPPKSLDRSEVLPDLPADMPLETGAATLAAFVAAGLEAALAHLPGRGADVRRWIVAGGGRRNPAILAAMRARLPGEVVPVETLGHDGDMIEAELFALLGVRRLSGIPSAMPRPGGRSVELLLGDLAGP